MDISLVNALSGNTPALSREDKKLKEATRDFEALLIAQMLKTMRNTIPEDTLLGESQARKIWQALADEEMATQIARSDSSLGIGDSLYQELKAKFPTSEK